MSVLLNENQLFFSQGMLCWKGHEVRLWSLLQSMIWWTCSVGLGPSGRRLQPIQMPRGYCTVFFFLQRPRTGQALKKAMWPLFPLYPPMQWLITVGERTINLAEKKLISELKGFADFTPYTQGKCLYSCAHFCNLALIMGWGITNRLQKQVRLLCTDTVDLPLGSSLVIPDNPSGSSWMASPLALQGNSLRSETMRFEISCQRYYWNTISLSLSLCVCVCVCDCNIGRDMALTLWCG